MFFKRYLSKIIVFFIVLLSLLNQLNTKYNMVVVIIASRGLWAANNRVIEDGVHSKFTALLSENQIDFIDLRKSFEAGGGPLNYHFKNDGHWNEKGHYLAAKEIYKYLISNCNKLGGQSVSELIFHFILHSAPVLLFFPDLI